LKEHEGDATPPIEQWLDSDEEEEYLAAKAWQKEQEEEDGLQ